eukprot:gene4236-14667_t
MDFCMLETNVMPPAESYMFYDYIGKGWFDWCKSFSIVNNFLFRPPLPGYNFDFNNKILCPRDVDEAKGHIVEEGGDG